MTISELIAKLQAIEAVDGDLLVVTPYLILNRWRHVNVADVCVMEHDPAYSEKFSLCPVALICDR